MFPFHLSSLVFLAPIASVAFATKMCNVCDYGGIADNATDIAPAITKAYANCVAGAETSNPADTVLRVPEGIYAIKTTVTFNGANCFTIVIDGELNLVFNPDIGGNLFSFEFSDNVVWKGTGTINGHGDLWRPDRNLSAYPGRPRLLRFQDCNNVDISGVTLINSPMFHVTIIGNNNVAHDMKIIADHIGATDGFDVSGNDNHVHDVSVENGDECVTVKTPTNRFVGENIQCYYSGGCNIGSFGMEGTASVQNVFYRNVTNYYGSGGIVFKVKRMIDSYPTASGLVKNLTYQDFTFTSIAYPIKIDSYWCAHQKCPTATGNITWQNVVFQSISGTGDSSPRAVIDINCIAGHDCSGLVFNDVKITKEGNAEAKVQISNACGSGLSELAACH